MNESDAYPQESLQQVLLDMLRRQIAVFLVIWLVIAVPISCEHHEIMNVFGMEMPADMPPMPGMMHMHHTEHEAPVPSTCSIDASSGAPMVTMAMSLYIAVMPSCQQTPRAT